jgi:hypothetical protein
LVLTGHSLGAGAACLLAFLLYEHVDGNISSRLEIPTSMIECWGYGCPPCVDKLLSANAPFIKNVVLQVCDENVHGLLSMVSRIHYLQLSSCMLCSLLSSTFHTNFTGIGSWSLTGIVK